MKVLLTRENALWNFPRKLKKKKGGDGGEMIYAYRRTGKVFCGWWMTLPPERIISQILKGGKYCG